jgi:outer membrane protein
MGVALLVALMATATSTVAAEAKIGVMNVQQIILSSDAGQKAKKSFDGRMSELRTKFKSEEEELKQLQDEIKKKSSAWSEEMKAEKMREFQREGRELQAKTEDARFEMKQLQDQELEPILKTLEKVVNDYGSKNGFTAILDAKNVIYFDSSIDLTESITNKLNEAMAGK